MIGVADEALDYCGPGGLFVPTTRDYQLGDDIYLLLTLPGDPQRYPVAGKVGWITPANAPGGRTQGVGVRFPQDEKTRLLKLRIEEVLGTSLSSSKPRLEQQDSRSVGRNGSIVWFWN